MSEALAVKWRPKTFDQITEQGAIKTILEQQLKSGDIKHGYLFCGPAGCGKTTAARIFANEINEHKGSPIELDAASSNSVDDIREMIDQAQKRSLDSTYKVFIIDECHMITPQGFNAFLKTLEEPPAYTIFIMCTTDPERIPKTILSRVQRYNFQKISLPGIVSRLEYILKQEGYVCE
jgi:DNA polymerase-3 subunit gamma/tau